MASPRFIVGESVHIVGGPFAGRRGVVTSEEAAAKAPNAFVPKGIDESAAVWVDLSLYGTTNTLVLVPLDQLSPA